MSSVLQTPEVTQLLGQEKVHRNLFPALLVEAALRRGEAELAAGGSLVAGTGKRTGRSPKDKFTIKDAFTENKVAWGSANQPFPPDKFDALYERVLDYLKGKELFVQDLFCGADPQYTLPIQVINEYAWHSLFVRQLFIRPTAEELKTHKPEFTIGSAPSFKADPKRDGTNGEVFVLVNFSKKLALIGGTEYAGEMKKVIFGVMNFVLPADPKAGFIHVLDRCRRDVVSHDSGELLEASGTVLADPRDGRRHQLHPEEVGHQLGKTLLGQQLVVQKVQHERTDPRAILHRRVDAIRERRARLRAAGHALAIVRTMFGDDEGVRFGQIEHLTGVMTDARFRLEARAAHRAGHRGIDRKSV